jgi:hypothetical protein
MKSTPSERLQDAALRDALLLTAAALQCMARCVPDGERHTVRFIGDWQHFGKMTIGQILDRANQVLEVA